MTTLIRPPVLFKLLADDVRWRIVTALARSDQRGRELTRLLRRPQNLVSYHLRQLLKHKLVSERRSAADGRDVYFSLRLDLMRQLFSESEQALHPGLGASAPATHDSQPATHPSPVRVLFLCTHNSARSQMAEAILRHLSQGQVDVHSAGAEPAKLHPLAIKAMTERDIPVEGQRSKPVSEFAGQRFDYIITVCDIAREACPVFPGDPEQIHWSFSDPAAIPGVQARWRAFQVTASELITRINYLMLLISGERHAQRGSIQ